MTDTSMKLERALSQRAGDKARAAVIQMVSEVCSELAPQITLEAYWSLVNDLCKRIEVTLDAHLEGQMLNLLAKLENENEDVSA